MHRFGSNRIYAYPLIILCNLFYFELQSVAIIKRRQMAGCDFARTNQRYRMAQRTIWYASSDKKANKVKVSLSFWIIGYYFYGVIMFYVDFSQMNSIGRYFVVVCALLLSVEIFDTVAKWCGKRDRETWFGDWVAIFGTGTCR